MSDSEFAKWFKEYRRHLVIAECRRALEVLDQCEQGLESLTDPVIRHKLRAAVQSLEDARQYATAVLEAYETDLWEEVKCKSREIPGH